MKAEELIDTRYAQLGGLFHKRPFGSLQETDGLVPPMQGLPFSLGSRKKRAHNAS